MRYRGVFFDAGETLLGPHPSFPDVFASVLEELGHTVTVGQIETAFEEVSPSFVEILDRTGSATWSTSREISRRFWRAVYEVAFDHLGISESKRELSEALYDRFTRHESYRLFPDALPALHQVKEAGLVLGLISNFEEWLEEMLFEWEVAHLFDLMVISGKEGIEKPDSKIFEIALERAGLEPADTMYVGDHPRIDVEAAEEVGMTGILIDRRDRFPDFDGRRISTLDELSNLISVQAGRSD